MLPMACSHLAGVELRLKKICSQMRGVRSIPRIFILDPHLW
jgi:hypothetical protein